MVEKESTINNPELGLIIIAIAFAIKIYLIIYNIEDNFGTPLLTLGFLYIINKYFIDPKKKVVTPRFEYNKGIILCIFLEIIIWFYLLYHSR